MTIKFKMTEFEYLERMSYGVSRYYEHKKHKYLLNKEYNRGTKRISWYLIYRLNNKEIPILIGKTHSDPPSNPNAHYEFEYNGYGYKPDKT